MKRRRIENGEIAHTAGSSSGGNLTGPTEEEMRQFEAEQAAKKKRRFRMTEGPPLK